MDKVCPVCNISFHISPSQDKRRVRCGNKCKGIAYKGKNHSPETQFQKGMKAWNDGKTHEEDERIAGGEFHYEWKGDKVGYGALHDWIRKQLTQAQTCRDCNQPKKLDLSNISGQYKRDATDWEWLCKSCHVIKDIKTLKQGERMKSKDFFNHEGRAR